MPKDIVITNEEHTYSVNVDSNSRLKVSIDGEGWDPTNKVMIWDGTEVADVIPDGSVNRLAVDASTRIVPKDNVIYLVEDLENVSSSRSMNVDGSVTPVEFYYNVSAGEILYLEDIQLYIQDAGMNDMSQFGKRAALTNGLKIEIKAQGTTRTFYVLQTNNCVVVVFHTDVYSRILNSDNLQGTAKFINPIALDGDQGDFVKITVQDDLTGLDELRSSITMWKEVS